MDKPSISAALMEPLIDSESQLISPLTNGKISITKSQASQACLETVAEADLGTLSPLQYFVFNANTYTFSSRHILQPCQCCCWHLFCLPVCKSEVSYMLEGSATNSEQDPEKKEPTATVKQFTVTGTSTRCSCSSENAVHLAVALGERKLFVISLECVDEGCFQALLGIDADSSPVNIKVISSSTGHVLGHFTLKQSSSRDIAPKKGSGRYIIKCSDGQQIRVERHRNIFRGHDYFFQMVNNCQEQIVAEMKSKPSLCSIEMVEDLILNAKLKAMLLGFMIATEVGKLS